MAAVAVAMSPNVSGRTATWQLKMENLDTIANFFFGAFHQARWNGLEGGCQISELTIDDAYQVQDRVTQKRIASGERIAGYKVGCTSSAIRQQFGFDEPIHAKLFAPRLYGENSSIGLDAFINCTIEPEIVIKTGKPLVGENLSDETLIDAIDEVSAGIELHHFQFWCPPPTVQELICSSGLHAGLVVGHQKVSPCRLSFQNEVFKVFQDGAQVASAPASEIMGGPLCSLRWLVGALTRNNLVLEKTAW